MSEDYNNFDGYGIDPFGIMENPIFNKLLGALKNNSSCRNPLSLEQALGEKMLITLRICKEGVEYEGSKFFSNVKESKYNTTEGLLETRTKLAVLLGKCQTFILKNDMATVLESLTLPDDYIMGDILPFDNIYIAYEAGSNVINDYQGNEKAISSALLKDGDNLHFVDFTVPKDKNIDVILTTCEDILTKRYAELSDVEKKWVSLFTYMSNKDVCEVKPMKMTYTTKRKLKNSSSKAKYKVNSISLPTHVKRSYNEYSNKKEVNARTCHFMVRGHYRWQWYASTQKHALKWIRPHMKGDESMPFKQHGYTVHK